MYTRLPHFVLGFHGCDKETAEMLLSTEKCNFKCSLNDYDWLGHGVYFWEDSPDRALDFAKAVKDSPKNSKQTIAQPYRIGAVIDLGNCLNLLDYRYTQIVQESYRDLEKTIQIAGNKMPENNNLKRMLDCAVFESLHQQRRESELPQFDSVRGLFPEGEEIYPNSGVQTKSHIQICVRNPNCIQGLFRILNETNEMLFQDLTD